MNKLSIIKEFWEFLKVRKKWWLAPIVIFLILLGALIIFTEGSALAPFIYTLFQKDNWFIRKKVEKMKIAFKGGQLISYGD